jgi:hypothetical protein
VPFAVGIGISRSVSTAFCIVAGGGNSRKFDVVGRSSPTVLSIARSSLKDGSGSVAGLLALGQLNMSVSSFRGTGVMSFLAGGCLKVGCWVPEQDTSKLRSSEV